MLNGGVLVQPRVVKAVGDRETAPIARGRVMSAKLSRTLVEADEPRRRPRWTSTARGPSSRASRSAARPARRRSGTTRRRPGRSTCSTTRSSATSPARPARPDLVVAVRIEEGTPTVKRLGHLEMPVMSFELFRRIAHDAITTPDLVPDEHIRARRRGVPVTAGCATLAPVTDPGRSPAPDPALTADDLLAATGGTLVRRSERADPRRRRRLPAGPPRATCSSRCPASAPTATATWAPPPMRARRRSSCPATRTPRPASRPSTGLGDVTVIRVPDTLRALHAVAAAWRTPVLAAGRRHHREHRQDLDQGGRRRRPREAVRDAADRGQPEQRGGPAAHGPAPGPGARGGRPRDGHVRRAARSATWRRSAGRRSAS